MPTRRFGKVRRMLKAGLAKPVTTKPFTIQLLYEPKTHIVDELTLGIDPGRTNIGIAVVKPTGEAVYSTVCETTGNAPEETIGTETSRIRRRCDETERDH